MNPDDPCVLCGLTQRDWLCRPCIDAEFKRLKGDAAYLAQDRLDYLEALIDIDKLLKKVKIDACKYVKGRPYLDRDVEDD